MSLRVALAALSIGVLGLGTAAASVAAVGGTGSRTRVGVPASQLRDIPKAAYFFPPTTNHMYYRGGRVLHANRPHLIFWQPRGSGLTFGRGYEAIIKRFLRNVAAASHRTSNVFALTGQYTDDTGPAAYATHDGRGVVDTDALPANGCREPATGPAWQYCLTDGQLQAELERVVRADGLPRGRDDVYFLLTPEGLASCMDSSGASDCSLAGPKTGYCGYHGVTSSAHLIYAVIPYNAVRGHCQSSNPRPNHSPADPTLSTISHELSEIITDPYRDAWSDSTGMEIGDVCLTRYGRSIGGWGHGRYNETINGGHYYLQEEWSNAGSRCRRRAAPDHASFTVTRGKSRRVWLVGRGRDPYGYMVGYHWSFGDGSHARGRKVSHRFRQGGSYRITLRATDDWDNWTFHSRTVTVGGRT